jgi:hypothetical protein
MAEPTSVPDKIQQNVKRDQEIRKFIPIIGVTFGLFFLTALVIVAMGAGRDKNQIRPKFEEFFSNLDRQNHSYLYDSLLCESVRAKTPRTRFLRRFGQVAGNLGSFQTRGKGIWQTKTTGGVSSYQIDFESRYSKGSVQETLTFKKEGGEWCFSDYAATQPS